MHEHFTPEEVQRAVRQLREHYQAHNGAEGCVYCDIWRAYADRDDAAFDAAMKRIDDDEFQVIVEMLRTDWGEGTWTDKESE